MTLISLQGPAYEPLSLPELQAYLRLDAHEEDALLSSLIALARRLCENYTGRSLIAQSWRLRAPPPPDGILSLPRGPVIAVDAVTLTGAGGETLLQPDGYALDLSRDPARLRLTLAAATSMVMVDYRAGYGADWNDVPPELRQGILRLIAHQYRFRDDPDIEALPSAVAALWGPFRAMKL